MDVGWHGVAREPREDVADGGLAGLEPEQPGDDAVLDDAAHPLGQRRACAQHHVAGARAHHRDHRAGSRHADCRHRHVGVDVGDRDRRTGRESGPHRGLLGEPTGLPAERGDVAGHLVVDDPLETRVEGPEERWLGEAVGPRPDRLVAGGAGVANLPAGQAPDHPVGRLDQAVGRAVDVGRLVEDLERLGVEPLGRGPAAVACEPCLAAVLGQRVDAVGLGLRGVMLPELDPGVRLGTELGELAERSAVGGRGQHRAGGEIDADPDDVSGVDLRLAQHVGHGRADRGDVVGRVLERPFGFEDNVAVRRRQPVVDDAVGVFVDSGRDLGATLDVDQHGATGLGAEVDADRVPHDRSDCP